MSSQLTYNDEQAALADSVEGYCRRAGTGQEYTDDDPLPGGFWTGLAELGVLGLGTNLVGGDAVEIAAVCEKLGAEGAPGPVFSTFVAGALLSDEELEPVVAGTSIVGVADGPIVAWGPRADLFIELGDGDSWLAEPGEIEPLETTAGEPWGRVQLDRGRSLGDPSVAQARGDVAIACYIVGASQRLMDLTAEYAQDRTQFGRSIGSFQAVSHPLASSFLSISAARNLARVAASKLEAGSPDAAAAAATARLSAVSAGTNMTYRAHQTYGAMGFTVEGPVAYLGHRIRQLGLLPQGAVSSREKMLAGLGI